MALSRFVLPRAAACSIDQSIKMQNSKPAMPKGHSQPSSTRQGCCMLHTCKELMSASLSPSKVCSSSGSSLSSGLSAAAPYRSRNDGAAADSALKKPACRSRTCEAQHSSSNFYNYSSLGVPGPCRGPEGGGNHPCKTAGGSCSCSCFIPAAATAAEPPPTPVHAGPPVRRICKD